jgi:hypothetical protein
MMQQPSPVISHLHIPMVRLQQHTTMPFIMQQQLHIVPARVAHRFCSILQAILSAQLHTIFMPPVHFSNLTVQRGTIAPIVGVAGMPIPVLMEPGMPIVAGPIVVGAIIVLVMIQPPLCLAGSSPSNPRLTRGGHETTSE